MNSERDQKTDNCESEQAQHAESGRGHSRGSASLERRVRRRVRGRMHSVAVICHPAMSDLLLSELELLDFNACIEDSGVLVLQARIHDLYRLSLQTRLSASFRIRLAEFRCTAREDLFRHLRGFAWEHWLWKGSDFHIRYVQTGSGIMHEGRAVSSAYKAVAARLAEHAESEEGVDPTPYAQNNKITESEQYGEHRNDHSKERRKQQSGQRIHIRIAGKRANISLEAIGDPLYKRGYAIRQGDAPLPETLAAAILNASPFALRAPIVDAMAGAGTFLCEAILKFFALWPVPDRRFAFENWRVYSERSMVTQRRHLHRENWQRLCERLRGLLMYTQTEDLWGVPAVERAAAQMQAINPTTEQWAEQRQKAGQAINPTTEQWAEQRQKAGQAINPTIEQETREPLFYAIERDAAVYAMLCENLERFSALYLQEPPNETGQRINEAPSSSDLRSLRSLISAQRSDIFSWISHSLPNRPGTVLWNPSYGWRLKQSPYQRIFSLFAGEGSSTSADTRTDTASARAGSAHKDKEDLARWQGIILLPYESGQRREYRNESRGRRVHRNTIPIPQHISRRSTMRIFPHGGRAIQALYIRPL